MTIPFIIIMPIAMTMRFGLIFSISMGLLLDSWSLCYAYHYQYKINCEYQ